MSRKDSKGLFAAVLNQLGTDEPAELQLPRSPSPHLQKVATGVRQLQERGDLADRLLRDSDQIFEFDPDTILPSVIPDRYDSAYDTTAIEDIAQSMRERGQIVPGLVRPHSEDSGKFQIVYGRRRLVAAKMAGIKFKAAIRELTDEQAVIIQGEENTNREDLSFIEKCSFAFALEKAGFKRDIVCASLSTSKSHVSEMIKIASGIPRELLLQIGAATEIGRGRWVEFVNAWEASPSAKEISEGVLATPSIKAAASQERFFAILKALTGSRINAPMRRVKTSEIASKGIILGNVTYGKSGAKLSFAKSVSPEFVDFILDRIETLHDEYLSRPRQNQDPDPQGD